jgi:hypothetical protein
MRNPVTIIPPRDRLPAQRCLSLAVVSIVVLGLPAAADARAKRKPEAIAPPVVAIPMVPAKVTGPAATAASLRAANDTVGPKTIIETPTGSIRGMATMGKAPIAATAQAGPEGAPSASPQRQWYPESHSYLRPYHYKWRYWTPG